MQVAAAFWSLGVYALGGGVTYKVTLNPDACREVHLGGFTVPKGAAPGMEHVQAGNCQFEVRTAGEERLFIGIACTDNLAHWLLCTEKYAVDLSHPHNFRRIDEAVWQAASPLARSIHGVTPVAEERGVYYRGLLLERSGPSWSGSGFNEAIATFFNYTSRRAAANSWDGIYDVGTILDPTWSGRNRINGHFWVDIYETHSGRPLTRIKGSFNGGGPFNFQGEAAWYGDRYYVMPVGSASGNGDFGLRTPLICDLDAPARNTSSGLKSRQ
jgi:hypothetical protein